MSNSHRALAPLALLLLFGSVGCPRGSLGTLIQPDGPFGSSEALVVAHTPDGVRVFDLEGNVVESLFRAGLSVRDVSDDGRAWVLSDSDTNLFLATRGEEPRRVRALDGRLSAVALSPDASVVVASRHADFSLPQRSWVDDDAVYVVDFATGAVTILPAVSDAWPMRMEFEKGGEAVWMELRLSGGPRDDAWERVAPASGERERLPAPADEVLRQRPNRWSGWRCESTGQQLATDDGLGDEGLNLVESDGTSRRVVQVEGRSRGFHDYSPTIGSAFFSPDCRHGLFWFHRTLWAVDLETGVLRRLSVGGGAFIDPAVVFEG